MIIISTPPLGLPSALDLGLAHSRCKYVARMDADDICQSGRLGKQMRYLDAHEDIYVVGGQAVVIADTDECYDECSKECSVKSSRNESNHDSELRVKECSTRSFETGSKEHSQTHIVEGGILAGMFPTHPVLLHWGMFFKCCLIHPTVMFRKDIIIECGGYSGTFQDSGRYRSSTSVNGAGLGSGEGGDCKIVSDLLIVGTSQRFQSNIENTDVSGFGDACPSNFDSTVLHSSSSSSSTSSSTSSSSNRDNITSSSTCSDCVGDDSISRDNSEHKDSRGSGGGVEFVSKATEAEQLLEVDLIEDYSLWKRILLR